MIDIKKAIQRLASCSIIPFDEDSQEVCDLAINAIRENSILKNRLESAYVQANNAIYFDDNSDYLTTLYEVCRAIKPEIEIEEIGKKYINLKYDD